MGAITEHWDRWEHPIAYGIFFPDDTHVQMQGLKVVGDRAPVSIGAADWVDVDPIPLCDHPLVLSGGELSWEGTGLLAVCDPGGQLRWILHCEVSEPFVKGHIEDDCLIAMSEEYPRKLIWRIPLHSPLDCQVAEE